MFSKTIIVFDKDVDIQNVSEAAWIAGTHVDPQRDIQFTIGPMDDLENASNLPAYGSKMGIDATRKWPAEGFAREWPTRLKTTDAAARKAEQLLKSISTEK
jgi:4-hydroxy-3-polyprenylbenzoate decarboxylase